MEMLPADFLPNTRVMLNFVAPNRSEHKVGMVVDEPSTSLNSKTRGCVMVKWDNEKGTVPVHPSNLIEIHVKTK